MKKAATLICTASLALSFMLTAEERKVFTISEIDPNGKFISDIKDGALVDVNSEIVLRIDQAAIDDIVARLSTGQETQSIIEAINTLSDASRIMQDTLPDVTKATETYLKEPNLVNLKLLEKTRRQTSAWLTKLEDISSSMQTRIDNYEKELGHQVFSYQDQVMTHVLAAKDELAALENRMQSIARDEGFFLQAGGWITSQGTAVSIHLPGFDSITESTSNEIPRYQIGLTEKDKAALSQYATIVSTTNSVLQSGFSNEDISKQLSPYLESIKAIVPKFIGFFSNAIIDLGKTVPDSIQVQQLNEAVHDANTLLDSIESMAAALAPNSQKSVVDLLTNINNATYGVANEAQQLAQDIEKIKQYQGSDSNISKILGDLIANITAAGSDSFSSSVNALTQIFSTLQFASAGKSIGKSTLDFSDAIQKWTPGQEPVETKVNLMTTGRQGAGDKIQIRLILGQNEKKTVFEYQWSGSLAQEGIYITTVPGMVLLTPLLSSPFQAAVAYSVLLKGGIRDPFWDNILSPGIGINVAAPTFNTDRTPELGLGLCVTVFRDILGTGIGYDLWAGKWYWLIVFNLPLSTFGLPNGTTTTGSSK